MHQKKRLESNSGAFSFYYTRKYVPLPNTSSRMVHVRLSPISSPYLAIIGSAPVLLIPSHQKAFSPTSFVQVPQLTLTICAHIHQLLDGGGANNIFPAIFARLSLLEYNLCGKAVYNWPPHSQIGR